MAADGRPVTVVTVTRNNLEGLRRTFASLRLQSYRDVQHVVIDGASTDGSVEWLGQHGVFDDTVVVSEPDNGIYDAMNKGARLASGLLLNFLNAGDTFARESVVGDVVASQESHGWAWAFGLARVVDEVGRPLRPVRPIRYSIRRHALGVILVPHQAVFMRTALFRELGGFDEQFGLVADVDLLVRTGLRHQPVVWDRVDVERLVAGLSEQNVYRGIYGKHLIRRSVPGIGLQPDLLDLAWTGSQIATTAMRRIGKRTLDRLSGGGFTRWWASRGL